MEINKNTNSINTTGALNSNAPVKNDESSGAKAKIEKKEKVITLKSLKANILKKQQLCSKNEEKAQQYRKEIAEYDTKLKEIKKITKEREKAVVKLKEIENQLNTQKAEIIKLQQKHEELYRESIQQKIEIMWLKNGKVSSDQIEKFLELCGHLQDRINDLSINEILDAISLVSEEKAENK